MAGKELVPGLQWAIQRCEALQGQGFDRVRTDRLAKDFQNCLTSVQDTPTGDHDALLKIQEQMDGVAWTPDTLEAIARILGDAGYPVADTD